MTIKRFTVVWDGGEGTVQAFSVAHAEAECVRQFGIHPTAVTPAN